MKSDDRLWKQAKIVCLCIMGTSALGMLLISSQSRISSDTGSMSCDAAEISAQPEASAETTPQPPTTCAPTPSASDSDSSQATPWTFTIEGSVSGSQSDKSQGDTANPSQQSPQAEADTDTQQSPSVIIQTSPTSEDDSGSASK